MSHKDSLSPIVTTAAGNHESLTLSGQVGCTFGPASNCASVPRDSLLSLLLFLRIQTSASDHTELSDMLSCSPWVLPTSSRLVTLAVWLFFCLYDPRFGFDEFLSWNRKQLIRDVKIGSNCRVSHSPYWAVCLYIHRNDTLLWFRENTARQRTESTINHH